MNYTGGTSQIYTTVGSMSRVQEKEELQRLNDRFASYVGRVRQLNQQVNNVDTSAFLQSTKILEEEIINLKHMYELELSTLRKEMDAVNHERNSANMQYNKQQQFVQELQDRLSIETEKTMKLMDEINVNQRKLTILEAQVQESRIAEQRPRENVDQLQRNIDNLTREKEQWKHRYEQEQLARQEIEEKMQQIVKRSEFSEQVHSQQILDYQTRLDTSAAAIVSLEVRIRELSTADTAASDLLKQVRDTAEAELKHYQIESEEQYSRNLSTLKAQIDNDADALKRYQTEKSELIGSIGELHAKIRNLEGQVVNLQHHKQTLEDAISVERNRAADNIQQLEKKLRSVQDTLVMKMREVTNARESNIPLKAEIEAWKVLLEEEEKRLRVPLGIVPASVVDNNMNQPLTAGQILASGPSSHILSTSLTNALMTSSSPQQATSYILGNDTRQAASMASHATSRPSPITQNLPPLTKVVTALPQPVSSTIGAVTGAAPTSTAENTGVISANYNYSSNFQNASGLTNPLYPYEPSPPLDTLYVPEALQSLDEGNLAYDADYGAGVGSYEMYMQGFSLPMSGPRYHYEATPSVNCLHVEPSPPLTPKAVGPVQPQTKSGSANSDKKSEAVITTTATGTLQKDKLIPANLGSGRDYYDEMFHDLQRHTLFSKPRPKSSPLERRMPSPFHDYTVSTSSAIGDLKILEVNQDGKFVRLINDGATELEFGGFMIQQNVGGHPVAMFRFPPRTKFPSNSVITVWSATNDPQLHNPPTDFFWKEQQKWGTGPECTTILCRANGQAVAWTTAAHRFTKDAFAEITKTDGEEEMNKYKMRDDDIGDDESLTELNMDANGPKPEPVYLKREKQHPPSLVAPKHPHGGSPCIAVHPHTGQQRPLRYGNDNSSYNRQSRTQTTRPDPVPGAPAQRMGSAPLRKFGCNQGSQPPTIRGNGSLANKSTTDIGETCEGPSPFMKPHTRFESGLDQVCSQHHPDFLPPMPHPPQPSW